MNNKIGIIAAVAAALIVAALALLWPEQQQTHMQALLEHERGGMVEWHKRLLREAEEQRVAPVDARIDRVWKAIPGYNGLEVDIEQTLPLALNLPADAPIPFVFREVEPAVQLENLPVSPIYRGNRDKPMIAFMINVAWGNEHLPGILQTLRDEQVKATFFLDGQWLKANKEMAQRIQQDGHELSNHAYSHKNMSQLGREQAIGEIERTEMLLKELGVQNRWFAPPSGDYDQETVQIARELGLYTVMWTIDTVDWRLPKPEWIVSKITRLMEPGALILMHPTSPSAEALPTMIRAAKQRKLAIGTVSDILSSNRVLSGNHFIMDEMVSVEQRFDF